MAFSPGTAHYLEIRSYRTWWGAASPIMNDIRGQFRPSGIAVVCVCVCPWVRMCVNPELVRTITRHPFTLYQIWTRSAKTHWLRSLLFKGWLIMISKANSILNIQIFIAFGLSTKVNTQPKWTWQSFSYLDRFTFPTVSRSVSYVRTFLSRMLHSLDCFTVSTLQFSFLVYVA